ncbi:MAG: hypothetical protein ACOX88_02185 [Christensenellales bacterium]|jgi:hypothetical protein
MPVLSKTAAAWAIFHQIISRSAESLTALMTYPGGGQYACLTAAREDVDSLRPVISINLNGTGILTGDELLRYQERMTAAQVRQLAGEVARQAELALNHKARPLAAMKILLELLATNKDINVRNAWYERDGSRYYSSLFNHVLIEANIRKAFYDKRDFTTSEELIPEEARLLHVENFTASVRTDTPGDYYPEQDTVQKIVADDKGELEVDAQTQAAINALLAAGQKDMAQTLRSQFTSHPAKDRSFHYLPYKTDSSFERTFLKEVLVLEDVKTLGLEVYYNGDRALTEFKIRCYKSTGDKWWYIGVYTPDFLIIRRKNGAIHKAVIVETKGRIYANDLTFIDKCGFMQIFKQKNNTAFGYERFEYLYLEDTLPETVRIAQTHQAIKTFFTEGV